MPLVTNALELMRWIRNALGALGATSASVACSLDPLGRMQTYSSALDIWSCGCIMGELLANDPLLPGRTDVEQLSLIYDLLGTSPSVHMRTHISPR